MPNFGPKEEVSPVSGASSHGSRWSTANPGMAITNFASMATGASGDIELERKLLGAVERCYHLWCKRHRKYGRGNIARYGAVGCLIRSSDKDARLEGHYFESVKEEFSDESVLDAWMDKVNYAIMGLMCYLGMWPGAPDKAPKEPA